MRCVTPKARREPVPAPPPLPLPAGLRSAMSVSPLHVRIRSLSVMNLCGQACTCTQTVLRSISTTSVAILNDAAADVGVGR